MSDVSDAGGNHTGPYRALHLQPSAPQDLVVEVYWHLVSQLFGEPDAERLKELNKSYEVIVKGFGAQPLTPATDDAARRKQSRRKNLRAVKKSAPGPTPTELLQVTPDAPGDVVDLAYGYWRVQFRQRVDADARIEELERAYLSLRTHSVEAPPDQPVPETARQVKQPARRPPTPKPAEPHRTSATEASKPGLARAGWSRMAAAFRSFTAPPKGASVTRQVKPSAEQKPLEIVMSSKKPEPLPPEIGPDPKIEERFSDLAQHDPNQKSLPRRPDATRDSSA